jgi:hypothetical protein
MANDTHIMILSDGWAVGVGDFSYPLLFRGPLSGLGKDGNWYVTFYRLPDGKRYEDVRHEATTEYIQAAGDAQAMAVEIRKPGGEQWGAKWVRYIVGHQHEGNPPLDVAIPLPDGNQWVNRFEVFGSEEAVTLFESYHQTGDIPPAYRLRPEEGYTASGELVDLRNLTA